MLTGKTFSIPAGTQVPLVAFDGEYEVVLRLGASGQVYLGNSSVSDTDGFLWSTTGQNLTLRLQGEPLYAATGPSSAVTLHVLAYSV